MTPAAAFNAEIQLTELALSELRVFRPPPRTRTSISCVAKVCAPNRSDRHGVVVPAGACRLYAVSASVLCLRSVCNHTCGTVDSLFTIS